MVIDDKPVSGRDGSDLPGPTNAVRIVPKRLSSVPAEVRGIDDANAGGRISVDVLGMLGSPTRADGKASLRNLGTTYIMWIS